MPEVDRLVGILNEFGYQPFAMERTNASPPDVLTVSDNEFRFWGDLDQFYEKQDGVPVPSLNLLKSQGPNIEYEHTSKKSIHLGASCLKELLKCIGISSIPKIDLSFCGSSRLTFCVTGVTSLRIDPIALHPLLERFTPRIIPDKYVNAGKVYIAYDFLYASTMFMQLEKGKEFSADITGKIHHFLDLGVKGSVEVQDKKTLKFSSANGDSAAFAFRSGMLFKQNDQWKFDIHDSILERSEDGDVRLRVPARGKLLLG